MHFSITSSLLLLLPNLALSSPAPISPRQLLPTGQTVRQDVVNIHNAVLALNTAVESFNGGPFLTALVEGTPVLLGVAEIHRVNRAGFRHALAALPFTVEDSVAVVDAVVGTVNKSIPASTEILKRKQPAFKDSGFTAVVLASLSLLLSDHDTFSAATLTKISTAVGEQKTKEGLAAVENIHNVIQEAIVFYTANAV